MTLRVLVASDAIGELDPPQAGAAIARGWAEVAQVAVVPLADGGPALGAALAALLDGDQAVDGPRWRVSAGDTLVVGLTSGTSAHLGTWLADCLAVGDRRRLVLDLTGIDTSDGGVGLLAALGAELNGPADGGSFFDDRLGITAVDLTPVRLGVTELLAVVPPEQAGWTMLGLQGAVVRRGYAEDRQTADILAEESAMAAWLRLLGVSDGPGVGAAGGAAAAVLALGGRAVRGAGLCADLAGLDRTVAVADLVVTGCSCFDIGTRGGGVVGFVAEVAVAAERPCLVFAAEASVSRREMRTFGVEAAYAADPGPLPDALTTAVRRVAVGWTGAGKGHLH
ncbi:MAG: glycerate kinase [Propionicimonas sp.]|uniref:glycerate kinase n=1 Tax=Propionicimonas sp. TaxID=1955623 RepID=UPI002B221938|nr:glycerate kinase [Propionicimonas sp.]MEA4944075.1 glycerate kinase [Propionicimonas sp.]MEA5054982.1 glycerate kinase [Propionicimonas sp.]